MKTLTLLLLLGITQASFVEKRVKHQHKHHHSSKDWDEDGEESMSVPDYVNDSPDGYKEVPLAAEKKAPA